MISKFSDKIFLVNFLPGIPFNESDHYVSYDKFSSPYKLYELPKVVSPHTQFSSHAYYELTRFWPEQVTGIIAELTLLPDVIIFRSTRHRASKDLAIFLLLWRWHKGGSWENVCRDMRQQQGWCLQIYREIFWQLRSTHHTCVCVLDYPMINWRNVDRQHYLRGCTSYTLQICPLELL
jgi:hypothetical protein